MSYLMPDQNVVFIGHVAKNVEISFNGKRKTVFAGSGYQTSVPAVFVKTPDQRIGVVGRIGTDTLGHAMIDKLRDYGVDIEGLEIARNEKTAWFELIETRKNSSKRKFRGSLEAGNKLTTKIPDHYKRASYVHLATMPPQQQIEWLETFLHQLSANTKLSIDTLEFYARQFPDETLKSLNCATGYVFINDEEWEILENWGRKNRRFDTLVFSVPIIRKHGAMGATIFYPDGESFHVPARKVNYVNGTGAGEVLAGVFLTLRAQGRDEKTSLQKAVELASLSVEDFGIDHLFKRERK